ncbi:MAG: hypothetical protein ACR2PT_03805 [Endozoicomonas sp.]
MTALLLSNIPAALPLIILVSLPVVLVCAVMLVAQVPQPVPVNINSHERKNSFFVTPGDEKKFTVKKADNKPDRPGGGYCHERR